MEDVIKTARAVIAAMRKEGECPLCMTDLWLNESHAQTNDRTCPYEILEAILTSMTVGNAPHDSKYYVWNLLYSPILLTPCH